MSTNGSINAYFIVNNSDGTLWSNRVWADKYAAAKFYNRSVQEKGPLTEDAPVRVECRTLHFPDVPSASWEEIKEVTHATD